LFLTKVISKFNCPIESKTTGPTNTMTSKFCLHQQRKANPEENKSYPVVGHRENQDILLLQFRIIHKKAS
jgi:hypothetical protein